MRLPCSLKNMFISGILRTGWWKTSKNKYNQRAKLARAYCAIIRDCSCRHCRHSGMFRI